MVAHQQIHSVKFIKAVANYEDLPNNDLSEIVFSGKSNVGKSSLINSLLGKKKIARVSDTPGRTQTINYFLINDKFYFVDLPGYGYAKVPIKIKNNWNKLLDKYLNNRPNIKLIVQLLDFRHLPTDDDMMMIDWLKKTNKNFIITLTKCDKINKTLRHTQLKTIAEYIGISIENLLMYSSTKQIGIFELWKIIKSHI